MQYTVTLVELLFHYRNALNKRPRHLLNFSIFRRGVYSRGTFKRGRRLLNFHSFAFFTKNHITLYI